MFKQKFIAVAMIVAAFVAVLPTGTFASSKPKKSATFKVRIENVSSKDGLVASDESHYPFVLSPGIFVLSDADKSLFKAGRKASAAIEAQAEDGDPTALADKFLTVVGSTNLGVFNMPVGSDKPAPILPGDAFEFTFTASEGTKLNLTTMFGQSNDLFYAPERAISLFDNGKPLSGDITANFQLWDAGTEVNEAPGIGADQAPRQKAKNTGAAENGVVHLVKDRFAYPDTKDVLRITIVAQ